MKGQEKNSKTNILYIDDDSENLLGFEVSFSRFYQVCTALDTTEGYRILKEHEVSIALVDYKMPKEDGITFVERVRAEFPDLVFIIISAWADLEVVLRAINLNCFYGFVQKPWHFDELRITLRNAADHYWSQVENKNLTRILQDKNQELLHAIDREREASRVKNVFLQNISHEIRTPLNSIMGFTNLIKSHSQDERIQQFATFVTQSGNLLLNTIHSTLESSLILSNQLETNITSFDLASLTSKIVNDCTFEVNPNNLQVVNGINPSIILENDKEKVERILMLVLENAIKFTVKGSVEINSTYHSDQEQVVVSIRDTGIGIEKEKLAQIFEPFRQSDETTTRMYSGCGMGLFIAKSYAEYLGGRIWVDSAPGKGSTFFISFRKILYNVLQYN